MAQAGNREIEIKLRAEDLSAAEQKLLALGGTMMRARVFESNRILDTAEKALKSRGEVIRIRTVGGECVLTFKGPGSAGKHKSREELETKAADAEMLVGIFGRLGFALSFRYDKYRTEYRLGEGIVTLDETPIGQFLELEGAPEWIDETAAKLGYREDEYVTASYGELYREHCETRGVPVEQMVFPTLA